MDAFQGDHGYLLVVVIPLVNAGWSGQGISGYVGFSWDVLDFVVILL